MEAHVHAVPVAKARRQVTLGDARPEAEQHGFYEPAVIFGRDTDMTAVAGQPQLLQAFPLIIA